MAPIYYRDRNTLGGQLEIIPPLTRLHVMLVISDLRMAAMGGIQLLKTVRADDQLKNTPFILMTGSLDVPNVLAAKHAGTDAYLLKPFSQDQLKAKLLEVLTDHHLDARKSSPGVLRPPGR